MKSTLPTIRTLAATLIAFGSLAGGADAALVITIQETGSAVVVLTSGSVDLSGTTQFGGGGFSGPQGLINGATHGFGDPGAYGLASSHGSTNLVPLNVAQTPFGILPSTAASIPFSPNIIGMEIGYLPQYQQLVLPSGYTSGTPIDFSVTLSGGTTLADFGFDAGSSWGVTFPTATGSDSITFQTTPEPSSALLIGLGVLGAALGRRRN